MAEPLTQEQRFRFRLRMEQEAEQAMPKSMVKPGSMMSSSSVPQEQQEVLQMGQQEPQYHGTSEELAKGLLEVGGMVLGGGAGGQVVRKAAPFVRKAAPYIAEKALPYLERFGRILGSTLGGGGGATVGELAMPSSGMTWPQNQPFPNMQVVGQTFERGAEAGALGEAGGQVLSGVGQALKGQVGRILSGVPRGGLLPADAAVAKTADEMGVTLRPSELSGNDVAAQIEQNARRSMFGKNKFQQLDIKNEQAFRSKIEDYANTTFERARTPQESGRLIQDAIEQKIVPEWQAVNRGLYRQLSQQTQNQPIVSTTTIFDKAKQLSGAIDPKIYPKAQALAQKIEELVSESGYTTGLTVKKPMTDIPTTLPPPPGLPGFPTTIMTPKLSGLEVTMKSEGAARPKPIDFMAAHDARSLLLDITRTGEGLPTRVQGIAGSMAKTIDTAMEDAAKLYDKVNGTTLENSWRVANASTKYGHELFDSEVIRAAVRKTPEDVVRTAFNKEAVTETDRIMEVLGQSPQTKSIYQRAAVSELMKRATAGEGYLNGHALWNAAYGKNGVGAEVMRKTFGPEQAARLKEFFDVGRRMNLSTLPTNAGNPSQTGRTLINWFEQGMVIQLPISVAVALSEGQPGAAAADIASTGAYILTIDRLSRLLNSPEGTRLLTQGLKVGPKAQVATRVATGILAILGTSDRTKEKE